MTEIAVENSKCKFELKQHLLRNSLSSVVTKSFQIYTVSQKKHARKILSISSPNIDRLSKFFYWHILQKIDNDTIIHIYEFNGVGSYRSFTAISVSRLFSLPKCLLSITISFSYICISQGSVTTQLRYGEIFNKHVWQFFSQCVSERIIKIGQYLEKIWMQVW